MSKRCLLPAVALLLIGTAAFAQQETQFLPQLKVESAVESVELARPFELHLKVRHHRGTKLSWPQKGDLGPALGEQYRSLHREALPSGLFESRLVLRLQAFDTALREIPAVSLAFVRDDGTRGVVRADALPLRVQGTVGSQPRLRPLADPVDVLIRDWRFILLTTGLGLACLLLALVWFLVQRRRGTRKRIESDHAEARPAHELALAKLDALEASGALDADTLKGAFLAMSEIFREYLGRRFSFSALDLTSSEIRSRLASIPQSEQWLGSVDAWLERCDLVKYANSVADPDEARQALYSARILIDRTKEVAHERPRSVARG